MFGGNEASPPTSKDRIQLRSSSSSGSSGSQGGTKPSGMLDNWSFPSVLVNIFNIKEIHISRQFSPMIDGTALQAKTPQKYADETSLSPPFQNVPTGC